MDQYISKNSHKAEAGFLLKAPLSVALGVVFSVFHQWIYGFFLVFSEKNYLVKKALYIEQVQGIALPSSQNLAGLSPLFLFNCGSFFGLSLGIFLGIVISLLLLTCERLQLKKTIGLLVGIGLVLCSVVGKGFSPLFTLVGYMTLPFVVFLGQVISSYLLRQWGASFSQIKKVYSFSLLLLVLFSTPFLFSSQGKLTDYIMIRDTLLLTNPVGNFINFFYYNHSPFAAEVIKPLKGKRQFTFLYVGNDSTVSERLQRYNKEKMWFFLNIASNKEEAVQFISSGGIDLIFIDEQLEGTYEFLSDQYDIAHYSVFLTQKDRQGVLATKYFIPEISYPLDIKKIKDAIGQVSSRVDAATGFRSLIKLALFDYLWVVVIVGLFLIFLFFVSLFMFVVHTLCVSPYSTVVFALFGLCVLFLSYTIKDRSASFIEIDSAAPSIITLITSLDDEDNHIRYRSSVKLARMAKKNKGGRLAGAFMKVLEDRDPRVRLYAAEGLGNLKFRRAVPQLIRMLDDSQFNVRYKAAEALGKIGDQRALAPLTDLVIENNIWYVSDYALRALRRVRK